MAQLGRFPRTIAHSIRIQNRTVWTLPKRENYKGGEGGDPIEVGAGDKEKSLPKAYSAPAC